MIANGLQVVGLALVVLCGFLIVPWLGFLLAGIACFATGVILER